MNNSDYDTKHLNVLDGIRALSILLIVWYHFWQQNWIMPIIGKVSFDFIPRYGFLLVDMMILISGFCLFIPYARTMVYKEKMPKTRDFYIKRIARIFPSYYIALIISFIFWLFKSGVYNAFFIKDTIMHIFLVNNWSLDTLVFTNYNVVLWTVALEVQLYLIFPFVAKRFVKKPVLTYCIMMIFGIVCTYIIKSKVNSSNIGFYVNHFLTFIPVLANGMLASWFYISYTKGRKRDSATNLIFTVLSIFAILVYVYLCNSIGKNNVQEWQINNRLILSFLFMLFIISTLLASKLYQKIFSNRFMRFIAEISFNLYIYHQFIAVKLKEFRIPYYIGSIPPNMTGNTIWQWTYFIICIVISLLFAIMMTYLVERPLAKLIKKKFKCDNS